MANKNIVNKEHIEGLYEASEKKVLTLWDKCTVVSIKLPNGFVITETTGCVDPKNYSEEIGEEICKEHIIGKLWLLEGYLLQDSLHKEGIL